MLAMAALYWRYARDCPQGNYAELRARGIAIDGGKKGGWDSFRAASANYRVWLLFITYGACFGVELFIHNVAASYYVDRFGLSLGSAGMAAASFGLLALFARALGGWLSDRWRGAAAGRTHHAAVRADPRRGPGLLWFAHADHFALALAAMLAFGLFTHMACGATYALVPFIDRKALGGVAGIIGAGGNVGAVAAGFLLKGLGNLQLTLSVLGPVAVGAALCAIAIRFSADHKASEQASMTTPRQLSQPIPSPRPNPATGSPQQGKHHEYHRHRTRHGRPQVPGMPAESGARDLTVTVLCEEARPAYDRVHLSEFFSASPPTTFRWWRRASSPSTAICCCA